MKALEELADLPTSALEERMLLRGYSRVAVADSISRPCACGSVIVALSGSDDDIARAVRDHGQTDGHRLWAARWCEP